MFLMQSSVFAQSSGAEGQSLRTPWMMGNIIVVLFAIGLFALAAKSSRRDFSAIPDEFGNRPNAKNQKKKKGKQKLDFSKGPIPHPDIQNAVTLLIVSVFIPLILFFSLPAALRVRDEVKGDPRFLGQGTANAIVIFNYILLALWVLNVIGGIIGLILVFAGGGAEAAV